MLVIHLYDTGRAKSLYNTIRYDTIRYDTIRYDTIRYDTIRYDTIRYDTIRYDTIRYDTIQYNTIQLYCPGPGNSFGSVRHQNIKYRSREIKIQINSLLKQYVNIIKYKTNQ